MSLVRALVPILAAVLFVLPLRAEAQEATLPAGPLNQGLDSQMPVEELQTPYGTLEFFFRNVARHRLDSAAHALHLGAIPAERQSWRGPDLAGKLAYVLRRTDAVDWSRIPDTRAARGAATELQSGGLIGSGGSGNGASAAPTEPRRTLHVAQLSAGGRPQPINLQRFLLDDGRAVWLFSPYTVEEVDALYQAHGPGWLAEMLPFEARWQAIGKVAPWELVALLAILAGAAAIGWAIRTGLRIAARRAAPRQPIARSLDRSAWLIGAAIGALLAGIASTSMYLDDGWLSPIREVTAFVIFAMGSWLVWRVASGIVVTVSNRVAHGNPESDRDSRSLHTDIAVTRRILLIVLLAIALALVLAGFGVLPNFGLSLLASTGALGIVIAFAARPVLGNLASAAQIAATKPLTIGDIVTIDDHWARVEDLTFSYAVLRTWSNTRLIMPYSRLLSVPFESWSRHDETILRCVTLHVDYRADVAAIRKEFHRLLDGDERFNQGTAWLVVAELEEDTVKLEGWMSGPDSFQSWTLHNDVRERLLAFLQSRAATTLPRSRHLLDPMPSSQHQDGPGRKHDGQARRSDRVERPDYDNRPPPALEDHDTDDTSDAEARPAEGEGH